MQPTRIMLAAGLDPDPWQAEMLNATDERMMVLAGRQVGKTAACAAIALRVMLLEAPALVLVVSPSDRQSGEFVRNAKSFYYSLRLSGLPRAQGDSALQLHLDNGSRLVGLPDSEGKIRGYSGVRILFFEEASRVPDELHHACTPMLSVSHGRQIALSTAFGRRGWFFEAWGNEPNWRKWIITADQCPRHTPEFLEGERRSMPERWFQQEYFCAFLDPLDSVFRQSDLEAMIDPELTPFEW